MSRSKSLVPTVAIETITPRQAKKWLAENNRDNRPVNQTRVDQYADQMIKGKYILSPDSIAFDQEDRLFNGQHRLIACVKANVNFPAIVLRHAATEAFMVTDIGMKKLASQALSTMGYSNGSQLAATARAVCAIVTSGGAATADFVSSRSFPPNEIAAVLDTYPVLVDICGVSKTLAGHREKINCPATVVGVCLWLATEAGCYQSMLDFLKLVASDANHQPGTPALLLRRRLANREGSYGWKAYREMMALICKAYMMHRRGEIKSVLTWNATEQFPTLTADIKTEESAS